MKSTIPDGSYALITGGSQGIGRAIALSLATRGYNLLLVALPGKELEEAADMLRKRTTSMVHAFGIDLSREGADVEICQWVADLQVPVSVLVNNAGIGYVGPYIDFTHDFFQDLLKVNVLNLVGITSLMLADLSANRPSFILNIGSIASFFPMPYKTVYASSKAFVLAFSRGLREELKGSGVSVTVLCPGAVPTNDKVRARIEAAGKLGRLTSLQPEQVAEMGVRGMLKGKSMVFPGIGPKFSWYVARRIPGTVRSKMISYIFGRNKSCI